MITYKNKIEPLDIIIVYNKKSLLHRLIHGVTHYKAGHVALYLGDGIIIEAQSTGVKRKKWKSYKEGMKIYIGRYVALTELQQLKIRQSCMDAENYKYSFGQLVAILIKYLFKLKRVPDVSKKQMICSEFIAWVFLSAGIKLADAKPWETTPADILKSDVLHLVKGWE